MDVRPDRAHAAEIQGLVRNRLCAVVDQEDEAQGEQQKTEKPQNETNHGVAILRAEKCLSLPSMNYLAPRSGSILEEVGQSVLEIADPMIAPASRFERGVGFPREQ